jgi:hypothetical protein
VYGVGGSSTGGWDMVESAPPIAHNAVRVKIGLAYLSHRIDKLSTVIHTLYLHNNSTMLLYIQVRGSTHYQLSNSKIKNMNYATYKNNTSIEEINNNSVLPEGTYETLEEARAEMQDDEMIVTFDDNGDYQTTIN